MLVLDRETYRDKVYACWLGKVIGGTLGAPFEGGQYVNDLTFYRPVPEQATPNDDLDLQLVWLKMLEEAGPDPPLPVFAEYWLRYLSAYPWNEYGFCRRNLERGLRPPVSGWFENFFVDEEGSPIRSEIWACTAPADPQRAAAMAWKDSALDHAGGEGMHAEMFLAAVESAAFVLNDPEALLRIGLAMIPPACAIARVVREALWCRRNGVPWAEARHRIVQHFESGRVRPCNAIVNTGFVMLGWLYGDAFGERLCRAVNCGYDTDCTGATLGALLGLLEGTAGIPEAWRRPVGETLVLHKFTGDCDPPKNLDELTQRTAAVAETTIAACSPTVHLGSGTRLPADLLTHLSRNEEAQAALARDVASAVAVDGDLEITLHYGGEPVLHPGEGRVLRVSLAGGDAWREAAVDLRGPARLRIERTGPRRFLVTAGTGVRRGKLEVVVERGEEHRRAGFVYLAPEDAPGFAAGANVPTCRRCGGYSGACVCAAGGGPAPSSQE